VGALPLDMLHTITTRLLPHWWCNSVLASSVVDHGFKPHLGQRLKKIPSTSSEVKVMMVPDNLNVVHTHANCKDNPKLAWSFLHCFEFRSSKLVILKKKILFIFPNVMLAISDFLSA
jgi:hypothetical protein